MDGKLIGRLTSGNHLICRLSVTPRDGPAPVLKVKTVTANGSYHAADDGADGYSEFTANIHPGLLTPHCFDLSGGYVQSGVWTIGSDTVCYSDVYRVSAGTAYLISLGGAVGTRFRSMFSAEDTSTAVDRVVGKTIYNGNNPAPYSRVTYVPDSDGFITIAKDNAGVAGIRTYVFDLAALVDGNG